MNFGRGQAVRGLNRLRGRAVLLGNLGERVTGLHRVARATRVATGDGGRCTIGPVVIGPEAFALLGAQAPAEAPVPVAPATLEERVQALEARVDALERRRA